MSEIEITDQLKQEIDRLKNVIEQLEGRKPAETATGIVQTSLNSQVEALTKEIRMLRGTISKDYPSDIAELEFLNKWRRNFFAFIEAFEDEADLRLIGYCYEQAYRCCIAQMQKVNADVKIRARDSFIESLEIDKQKRVAKEQQRLDKAQPEIRKRRTAIEQSIDQMMKLGMTEEQARQQLGLAKDAK